MREIELWTQTNQRLQVVLTYDPLVVGIVRLHTHHTD